MHAIEHGLLLRTEALIDARRARHPTHSPAPARAGADGPRNVLLAGYCGAGNAGADIHMGEIIRQLRHLYRPDQVCFAYSAPRPLAAAPYADIPWDAAADDLATCLDRYDGVVVCEGSVFKSQFSNAMASAFIGLLGMAAAQGKPGIAYGVEAGQMDGELARFASAACRDSVLVARSRGAFDLLTDALRLPAHLGTDTAWTFAASAPAHAGDLLARAGWNGAAKIVCVAPVNPFWWPARPDPGKAAAMAAGGAYRELHRTSIFFHHDSPAARLAYDAYLDALALAVNGYSRASGAWPVLVAMERQDERHCRDLGERLDASAPTFVSGTLAHADLVAILRAAHVVVSSRYHALVTAMPGGVPGIAVTCDERMRNLMADRGAPECVLDAAAPGLAGALAATLRHVDAQHALYAASLAPFVATQLRTLGTMGQLLCATFASSFPELAPMPFRSSLDYLPPLDATLAALLARHPS